MLYAGFEPEGFMPHNVVVPGAAASQLQSKNFVGTPASNLNPAALTGATPPFWYKVLRHDKPGQRGVHRCTSERTHQRLIGLVISGRVTVLVSAKRPSQNPRR